MKTYYATRSHLNHVSMAPFESNFKVKICSALQIFDSSVVKQLMENSMNYDFFSAKSCTFFHIFQLQTLSIEILQFCYVFRSIAQHAAPFNNTTVFQK